MALLDGLALVLAIIQVVAVLGAYDPERRRAALASDVPHSWSAASDAGRVCAARERGVSGTASKKRDSVPSFRTVDICLDLSYCRDYGQSRPHCGEKGRTCG
jgi:hypothetical protein